MGNGWTAAAASPWYFIGSPCSLILPVRVVGVFEVPERPPAAHGGNGLKIVRRRRRRGRPLQRPGVPRVVARPPAPPQREQHVREEEYKGDRLDQGAGGGQLIPDLPAAAGLVGVNPPR